MKLYQIASDYKDLEEMEDSEAVSTTLEMIEGEFNDKANNILALVGNWDGDIAALDSEIKRLQGMKKSLEARKENLKDYLRHNMEDTGITKIECPLFKVSIRKGVQVAVVDDVDSLPDDCVTVKTTIAPDKREILKRLKAGDEINGAHLETGKSSLTIK